MLQFTLSCLGQCLPRNHKGTKAATKDLFDTDHQLVVSDIHFSVKQVHSFVNCYSYSPRSCERKLYCSALLFHALWIDCKTLNKLFHNHQKYSSFRILKFYLTKKYFAT